MAWYGAKKNPPTMRQKDEILTSEEVLVIDRNGNPRVARFVYIKGEGDPQWRSGYAEGLEAIDPPVLWTTLPCVPQDLLERFIEKGW